VVGGGMEFTDRTTKGSECFGGHWKIRGGGLKILWRWRRVGICEEDSILGEGLESGYLGRDGLEEVGGLSLWVKQ
jgi:hypothetical protein